MSEDPVKDGINWYSYCANNPLKYKDATGFEYVILWSYGSRELNSYVDLDGEINWKKPEKEGSFSKAAKTRMQELLS